MHDEDNKLGLHVSNSKGESWKAFGDAKLFEAENAENCKRLAECLQASIDEVYKAFETGQVPPSSMYAAERLVPTVYSAMHGPNHEPAFVVSEGGKVFSRKNIYDGGWWPTFINDGKHALIDWRTSWVEILIRCQKLGF